ncbi:MAG: hypothetical protein U1F68_19855 [Gammaproteobacteria bacterium]
MKVEAHERVVALFAPAFQRRGLGTVMLEQEPTTGNPPAARATQAVVGDGVAVGRAS